MKQCDGSIIGKNEIFFNRKVSRYFPTVGFPRHTYLVISDFAAFLG